MCYKSLVFLKNPVLLISRPKSIRPVNRHAICNDFYDLCSYWMHILQKDPILNGSLCNSERWFRISLTYHGSELLRAVLSGLQVNTYNY